MVKELYLKILISSWLVVFTMLAMQLSLNAMKFKSLVATATASQMQVVGSTIEAVVDRAEQVGLALEEIDGFKEFIQREAASDKIIERISVLSAVGSPLFQTDESGIPDQHKEAVIRRVFSVSDQESTLSIGKWLYSGRLLYDSSGAVMGAIVLIAPESKFMPSVNFVKKNLMIFYIAIIMLITATLFPTIFSLFRAVTSIYALLNNGVLNQDQKLKNHSPEASLISEKISTGNVMFQDAEEFIESMQEANQVINFEKANIK
ncbi:MAG: hypothetical protein P8M25_07720 [Paracoccaceae bacterium]|nr:hypothetical protein [Paracoccaceae bacterium]